MIEILMTVCLFGDVVKMDNNLSCIRPKDVKLSYFAEQELTPQQCVLNGQAEMAKWINEHPNYQVMRWRCGKPSNSMRTKA